ncbi:hypothetical protein HPB47_023279 [Ixodes persulcatus]|uniref:Uncharacterized protein n=1 Tax=Ixodes persulcatus TaxID=34615 RepID=A0AC60Q7C6_IXOPE|nr:hypothetical protein HPB47_023279 [Ixodes persulcatus]
MAELPKHRPAEQSRPAGRGARLRRLRTTTMVQGAACYTLGLWIIAATTTAVSCFSERDLDNSFDNSFDEKFFGSLIKTKDSRTFLSDLINKIQLLLNDTTERSSTPGVSRSIRRTGSLISDDVSTYAVSSKLGVSSSVPSSTGSGTAGWTIIANHTLLMPNETLVDVAAEEELKMVNQDSNQRVATLGVIICLTFVGTATCIVVMALYSSRFSGIILLSSGRWWCPMVTRGNGVERQLLV